MSRRLILPAVIALSVGACATIPPSLVGTYPATGPDIARSGAAQGTRVRWGGHIIETAPQQNETCFFVLDAPLDSQARPQVDAQSRGRFVACRSGFYDPEVYAKGRELTVTGTIDGSMTRKIGDYDYAYPRVAADNVYLWPKRPRYVQNPYYDPFYGSFGDPFWGFGPFWYPQPVIIVRPSHHHGR